MGRGAAFSAMAPKTRTEATEAAVDAETMSTLTWQRSHGADMVAEARTDQRGI